jgi:hypothetical protein
LSPDDNLLMTSVMPAIGRAIMRETSKVMSTARVTAQPSIARKIRDVFLAVSAAASTVARPTAFSRTATASRLASRLAYLPSVSLMKESAVPASTSASSMTDLADSA